MKPLFLKFLTRLFYQIYDDPRASVDWTLPRHPSVAFYKALHTYLKTFGKVATKTCVGQFYVAIDPAMKAKKFLPDNVFRFVENLFKLHESARQLVNYKTEIYRARKRTYHLKIGNGAVP